jgi:hypothetical protein
MQSWNSWVGKDRNGRDIQIDVVARLDDGSLLAGEIKWSSDLRGFELHNELTRNLDDLGRSGYGWAREGEPPIEGAARLPRRDHRQRHAH